MSNNTNWYFSNKVELKKHLHAKFLLSNGEVMSNNEMLELMLYSVHPSLDTREIAYRLLDRFNNFAKIFKANIDDLKNVQGINDSMAISIICVKEILKRMLKEEVEIAPIINNGKTLIEYLKISVGVYNQENFRIIYLNKKHRIIADELQNSGTINQTQLYIREVIKRALVLSATSIIISHNHPCGSVQPSSYDLEITRQLSRACYSMGIDLTDHIIVTAKSYFSFKQEGLLRHAFY